jgi:hypothetical protein
MAAAAELILARHRREEGKDSERERDGDSGGGDKTRNREEVSLVRVSELFLVALLRLDVLEGVLVDQNVDSNRRTKLLFAHRPIIARRIHENISLQRE